MGKRGRGAKFVGRLSVTINSQAQSVLIWRV